MTWARLQDWLIPKMTVPRLTNQQGMRQSILFAYLRIVIAIVSDVLIRIMLVWPTRSLCLLLPWGKIGKRSRLCWLVTQVIERVKLLRITMVIAVKIYNKLRINSRIQLKNSKCSTTNKCNKLTYYRIIDKTILNTIIFNTINPNKDKSTVLRLLVKTLKTSE